MWRGCDARDAVRLRGAQNVEAAVDRRRAVVDPGEDVRVEVDHPPPAM
jgi:hypothetical protein